MQLIEINHSNEPWILIRSEQEQEDARLVLNANCAVPWKGATFFPTCTQEFLFYLILAGSPNRPGIRRIKNLHLLGVSCADLVEEEPTLEVKHPGEAQNPEAISRDGIIWENICCSAFYFACNQGSVAGSPINQVIPRLIAHLLKTHSISNLSMDPFAGNFGDYVFPFMSPYNSPWHKDVHTLHDANFADLYRPLNSDRMDAFVSKRCIQLEMKVSGTTATILKALHLVDGRCKIAFILCNDRIDTSFFDKPLRSIKRKNTLRRAHVLKECKRYDSLKTAAVLILKLEGTQVLIEPHPQSPCPLQTADSLIFIISRVGIRDGIPELPRAPKLARQK